MEQRGLVVKTEEQYAYVKVRRQSACGSNCSQCEGCDLTETLAKVKNPQHAKVGDQVKIETSTKRILFGAFLMYLFPFILSFIIGAAIYYSTYQSEISVVCSVLIFILSYYLIYIYNKKIQNDNKYIGIITKIFS